MRSWLNLTLFGSLIWAAAGCCCYDPCCYYGGYNYPVTSYNYGGGYNTVATGGYNAASTNTYSTATAQTSAASTYVAGNQSKFSNTNTGLTNYAPTNQFAANNNYAATGNYHNGNVVAYQPQQTTVTPQFQGNMAMSGGSPCPPCPCESTGMTSGGLFMQDANGQMIPMEGMVYDASVMPSPMMTVPESDATEPSHDSAEAKPGQLVPVPQPQIGIPTSTDGRPLVPPAPE